MSVETLKLPAIAGRGFTLRPFRDEDASSLQRHINDESVARDVTNIPFPYTLAHAKSWIEYTSTVVNESSKRVDFAIEVNGEVAGSISFINKERYKAQVSYWLSPDHWGRGIATEALKLLVQFGFEKLDLRHIYGYVYAQNEASTRVLKRAGFTFTHFYPQEWFKVIGGELKAFDSYHFGINRQSSTLDTLSILIVSAFGDEYRVAQETAIRMQEALEECGHKASLEDDGGQYDLVISLGGDSTMMRAVRKYSQRGIPTLGVNAGDVGFLTSAEASEWESVVEKVIKHKYYIEHRMALRLTHNGKEFGPYVNDVVLEHPRLGHYTVCIDGEEFVSDFPAKGLLVTTATGSTAYNTAVGGPVIRPDTSVVALSIINPQVFSARSIVTEAIAQGGTITVKLESGKQNLPAKTFGDELEFGVREGFEDGGLRVGDSITISRFPQVLLFATFGLGQYPKALRTKKGFARQ